jgi:hypothetical protein
MVFYLHVLVKRQGEGDVEVREFIPLVISTQRESIVDHCLLFHPLEQGEVGLVYGFYLVKVDLYGGVAVCESQQEAQHNH